MPPATLKKTKPSPVAPPVAEASPIKASSRADAAAHDSRKDEAPSEVDISFGNMSSPASTIKNRRASSSMDLSDVDMTTPVQSPRRPSPAKAAPPTAKPPMNDSNVSDASIFSLRITHPAPVTKAAPLPVVRSQEEEESKAVDDEEDNAAGHRSFELNDDFEFDAPSLDDDDDTFGEKNQHNAMEGNRGSFGGSMTPIQQTEDHDLFSPPEVRPQFSSPPVSPVARRPTTPPTKKASKKSRMPVADTSDNENDMFEDASLIAAEPKTTSKKPSTKAPKRATKAPKQTTKELKEPKARGRPKKKKLAEMSFNDATDHSDMDAPPRRQDFTDNDDDGGESDHNGPRRSKRRRIQPLAWYKCERPVYERRDNGLGLILPTISHIERAGTNSPIKNAAGNRKKKSKHATFPASQLPPQFKYSTADAGELWDEASATSKTVKMIGRYGTADLFPLPAEDGVPSGFACQTFNVVGSTSVPTWISGRVLLPPGAVKASESVGSCAQVFVVIGCQPMALEVAFGHPSSPAFDDATASRFTLGPGDEFYVPANNAYFLRNHSTSVEAELRFMILKPKPSEKSKKQRTDGKKTKKPKKHTSKA
ncbi:hypothetical protein SPRG_02355 [Saprolegnia parasitica CBS 223.65]|uniref:Mif2/CENP-C cupin domain-containing protein n=1 Tax=Saprolegnia parasitica (strain CBS 223.65) TaxID=695850 RepID=A0A067CPM9_SAPPC|nr:hypothetical protein SPRG_02355 [Saprolegnia parasitica CBS 223.65]KDO32654.1 hypothetical protein SPRG_02355 [Saprolegnia parasitica CBS 223.65]|eukprot:XP_012196321.1 hypothetical protein SPRG_02355 [Saprolegnia parasitica CBS 223.65]